MKITRFYFCLLLLFLLTFAAAEARADTLYVNGGTLTVRNIGGGAGVVSFGLLGSNFTFGGGETPHVAAPGCHGCPPGRLAPSNFSTSGIEHVNFQIDGVGYHWREYAIGNAISIVGPSFVLAETVTVPFTFTGFVSYYENNFAPRTEHTLVGQGFVTIQHQFYSFPEGRSFFEFRNATYNFTPAPVPEPATLLLLATGLAGAGGVALRRRKALRDGGR